MVCVRVGRWRSEKSPLTDASKRLGLRQRFSNGYITMIGQVGRNVGDTLGKILCDMRADVIGLYWGQVGESQGCKSGKASVGMIEIMISDDRYQEKYGECKNRV